MLCYESDAFFSLTGGGGGGGPLRVARGACHSGDRSECYCRVCISSSIVAVVVVVIAATEI